MANESWIRASIASLALAETSSGVAASQPDPADPTRRKGWRRLLDYFHTAAPGVYNDENIKTLHKEIPDWCGIFALWAIKSGGASWVGTWRDGQGIASVPGMFPTTSPQPGDVGAVREFPQHMDIVYSVVGNIVLTIDGNSTNGAVTGPSSQSKQHFTAGFFTAFPSPVGTWKVQVGAWTWIYTFRSDGTAQWTDIRQPPTQSGSGTWDKTGDVLEISWDTGSREQWDMPLKFRGQQGNLVGQGRIITADKIR